MHFSISPLARMISEGEGSRLDFKKTISSAKKIAKTIAAFANSQGGSLLIGVHDSGRVMGIRLEEEMYMADSAARVYCEPPVPCEYRQHDYRGMLVLEVVVPESSARPHQARNEHDEWHTYVRVRDKTVLASPVMLDLLKREAEGQGARIRFGERERALLDFLSGRPRITLPEVQQHLRLQRRLAVRLLSGMVSAGVLRMHTTETDEFFTLA